jgi:hypothetical protein
MLPRPASVHVHGSVLQPQVAIYAAETLGKQGSTGATLVSTMVQPPCASLLSIRRHKGIGDDRHVR